MKIVEEFPPNWEKLKAAFAGLENPKVLITLGTTIYNPYKVKMREDMIVHEQVHCVQQGEGEKVDEFVERYIADPKFRVDMEVEAYGKQLKYIRMVYGNKRALNALRVFADSLTGPVYGAAITHAEALLQISNASFK